MKILSLIISFIFYRAGSNSKQTYYINKDAAVKALNDSIPIFQTISNEIKITDEFNNNVLYFSHGDFKKITNLAFFTGEISKERLRVTFVIKNLDELKNFNKNIVSSLELENIKFKFISMSISLINNIFQSSTLPEEDIEISSNEESDFLTSIRNLLKKNKNKVTISVTHKFGTCITFNCYLNENTHNVVRDSKPNESQEHEEAPLLDKKEQ